MTSPSDPSGTKDDLRGGMREASARLHAGAYEEATSAYLWIWAHMVEVDRARALPAEVTLHETEPLVTFRA